MEEVQDSKLFVHLLCLIIHVIAQLFFISLAFSVHSSKHHDQDAQWICWLWIHHTHMYTWSYWGELNLILHLIIILENLHTTRIFSCLRYEVAGGIMFSGCPSVRTYVRTSRSRDRVIWRTDWWIPAKLWSCMYLAEPMNWLDFGVTRSKVKGHRAHYVCKNSSWSRYLKNRLMDFCQTLVMYVSCRVKELIRFWGHEVKGHRSQGSLCLQKLLVIALSQEQIDGLLPNLGHVCYLQSRWTD